MSQGLTHNRGLRVEVYDPEIRQAREERERARFDTHVAADLAAGRETAAARVPETDPATADWTEARLGLERSLAFGTQVGAEAVLRRAEPDDGDTRHSLRVGVSVTQGLLRGAGGAVNRIGIRQAELETAASRHELRGYTEVLVARIETTYWDTVLASRGIAIVTESAQLAGQQLIEVEQRIAVGVLAPTERAAAHAETALRNGALIRARGDLDRVRLALMRLINSPGDRFWDRLPEPVDEPPAVMTAIDPVADHVALALRRRADLNQARLALERGELEVVRTRDGLLPKLDLFIRLGRTGYAESFSGTVEAISDDGPDFSVGLQLRHALGRREARSRDRESALVRWQAEAAVANLEQMVELDVRTAHIEVLRADEQVTAAAATRAAQEEKWRAEMEKFQVGRSTALLVAQVQRDLMAARLAQEDAVIGALKARIDLFRLDSSLLSRRGILVLEETGQ